MRGKLPAAGVVLDANGRTPSRQAVLSAPKEVPKSHSLPARSFHSLRHCFLSALVRGGANLEALRELAGHSKSKPRNATCTSQGADLRDAVSRLPGNAKPLGWCSLLCGVVCRDPQRRTRRPQRAAEGTTTLRAASRSGQRWICARACCRFESCERAHAAR
jgi:hypothetical protein